MALLTVTIWSSTFISTKVLLADFTPIEILVFRFTLAWLAMFALYPRIHRMESVAQEIMLVFAGIFGGSLYFVAENFALQHSLASNVSLLVSTAPIITSVAAHFLLDGEKLTSRTVCGALVAFLGVCLIVFNGTFVLKLNPLGDMLALLSALSWALYSILIKKMKSRHSIFYTTRKIFFYTLLTVLPLLFFFPVKPELSRFVSLPIALNFLFLTVFASCLAYALWNKVILGLGAAAANTFIYFIPLLTLVLSALILNEPITVFGFAGASLIFTGVYVATKNRFSKEKEA